MIVQLQDRETATIIASAMARLSCNAISAAVRVRVSSIGITGDLFIYPAASSAFSSPTSLFKMSMAEKSYKEEPMFL